MQYFIIFMLIFFWTTHCCDAKNHSFWLEESISKHNLNQIDGEIISITKSEVVVNSQGVVFKFHFAPEVQIWCNGLPAYWQALRPITPQSFFEAQIKLNSKHEAIYLNGNYRGEECIIKSWRKDENILLLYLTDVETTSIKEVKVVEGARLPTIKWLIPGQLVFVVYNFQGQVRALYLPD